MDKCIKYKGITPYNENEQDGFVGRATETWALYDRVSRNDYTIYYAVSGEGKSSLIAAGLLPILRRRGYFPVYIVFKDEELGDVSCIDKVIEDKIVQGIKQYNDENQTSLHNKISYGQSKWSKEYFDRFFSGDEVEKLKGNLWWKLRNYCFKRGNETELTPFFIFDQFEEVFTKANYAWTDAFFGWLEEISTDYVPESLNELMGSFEKSEIPVRKNFKVLFSFRTEYLGDLDYWCAQKYFLPSMQENRLCLKQMTVKGAKEVVSLNPDFNSYSDGIIKGCVDERAGDSFEETSPCVHALILSVVCQTLSSCEKEERDRILSNLKENQMAMTNEILLIFYREKLKQAGLDVVRDEKIIAEIEDVLIDENGKRKRLKIKLSHDDFLTKYINKLCGKENGLIKLVAQDDKTKTIEFPHDRLCLAIDSERKNRQKRIRERLIRQKEWMQFGLISFVTIFIAYMLNTLLHNAVPAINTFLHNKSAFWENIWKWLSSTEIVEYNQFKLNESFCIGLFLLLSAIFVPGLVSGWFKEMKKSKPSLWLIVISSFETILMGFLVFKCYNLSFEQEFAKNIMLTTFVFSLMAFLWELYKRYANRRICKNSTNTSSISMWPLILGYFLLGIYVFYLTMFYTGVGINEPKDSGWLVSLLSLLLIFGTLQSFKFTFSKIWLKYACYISAILSLSVLFIISIIPHYDKQLYGMPLSIAMLTMMIITILLMAICTDGKRNGRGTTVIDKISFCVINIGSLLILWYLSLGYNPFNIPSNKIIKVFSWRTVLVQDKVSGKYGVFTANGEGIIPFVRTGLNDSIMRTSPYKNGYFHISSNAIKDKSIVKDTVNGDSSFLYKDGYLTTKILVVPTLEEYFVNTKKRGLNDLSSLEDSIAYYATYVFTGIRRKNIDYVLTGHSYNVESINFFNTLDSLQTISLDRQIKSLSAIDVDGERNIDVDDNFMAAIYRELSRSMLLCVMRERLFKKEMPCLFQMHTEMAAAFFYQISGVDFNIYSTVKSIGSSILKLDEKYSLHSKDFNNNKLFAWYDLFCMLCDLDVSFVHDVDYEITPTSMIKGYNNELDRMKTKLKGQNLNTTQLKDAITVYLELSKTLDSLKADMSKIQTKDCIDYTEKNASFLRILGSIQAMSVILKQYDRGIYNNAIEFSYLELLNAAFVRKYDIRENMDSLGVLKKRYYNNYNSIRNVINSSIMKNMDKYK